MREQKKKKNDEKGTFCRTGQCAALSSFRVGNATFGGKGYIVCNFYKRLQKKESMRFN